MEELSTFGITDQVNFLKPYIISQRKRLVAPWWGVA